MCKPMSGYAAIIEDTVKLWVSERTDSHSEIAEEFHLRDNGRLEIFAFEFFPDASNPQPDAATWTLRWDSDATNASRVGPSKEVEIRFRPEIEKIASRYVFRDGSHKTTACRAWVFGEAELTASNSRVVARGSSRVVAWGSSRVEAWESSSVVAWESSSVVAWESSSVEARGSSRVVAWGSSSVVARGSSRVEARGSSRVVARESSRVEAWESSTTNSFGPKPVKLEDNAVWINRLGDRPTVLMADVK